MGRRTIFGRKFFGPILRDIVRCAIFCLALEFLVLPHISGAWHNSRYFRYAGEFVDRVTEEIDAENQGPML
jgi:hypothetical protein